LISPNHEALPKRLPVFRISIPPTTNPTTISTSTFTSRRHRISTFVSETATVDSFNTFWIPSKKRNCCVGVNCHSSSMRQRSWFGIYSFWSKMYFA
jgi:hypothetical protein